MGRHGTAWKLRVSAPAEDGRANRAVERLVASVLGVEAARVRIVRGAASRDKVVEIDGVAAAEAEAALAQGIDGR